MPDPLGGSLAELPPERLHGRSQHRAAGLFTAAGRGQRHDLSCAAQPFPMEIPVPVQQASVALVRNQVLRVATEQAAQLRFIALEVRLDRRSLCVGVSQHMIAEFHADRLEGARNIPERGEAGDLQLRDETAARLQVRGLQPVEDAEPHERQKRYGEQDAQASGDGHLAMFTGLRPKSNRLDSLTWSPTSLSPGDCLIWSARRAATLERPSIRARLLPAKSS